MQSGGDDLLSITVADARAAQTLAAALRQSGDWLEVVAGIDSVVVRFDCASMRGHEVKAGLQTQLDNATTADAAVTELVEIAVSYGGESGPDLLAVCEQLGVTREHFIDLHCGEYTVDMLGFTPGFAYIGGLDGRLDVPRLREPRVRVAAGSVGIADGRTGLYSLAGPGGWPIIGHTRFDLFDANSEEPFTLAPGMRVRFVDAERQ